MTKIFRTVFTTLVILLASGSLLAQDEDVMLKAMNDEVSRSMKELKLANYEKPCFIMFTVADQKTYLISGVLGSLLESSESAQRLKTNSRVLVGDYAFNDESLEDNLFSSPTAREISLPVDNDYLGIRRAFWSTTDKVYRDAARHFDKHKETLKETGKPLADIPHRAFAKVNPVNIISTAPAIKFDKSAWETRVRNLSALFLKHPAIAHSAVIVQITDGHKYLSNSEGTSVKLPLRQATLTVVGQTKNEDGEFVVQQVFHAAASPDELPTEKELTSEVEKMIADIEGRLHSAKCEEEYSGPVLLIGPAVPQILSTILLEGRETIMANDNIPKLTGYRFDADAMSMDGKIGKNVCHESITIKARPKLNVWKGTPLLGSFEVDNEGVAAAEEVTIIDKGILRNLLNNRTITTANQPANGFSEGPGVLEVTIAKKDSEKVLKDKLIAKAKEEGLEFGLIVREMPVFGLMTVYKVSVSDGKEELLRNAVLNQASLKSLKKISGASENYSAYNLRGAGRAAGPLGIGMISLIVPDAILIDELEVMPLRLPSLKEEEYVSNPLN